IVSDLYYPDLISGRHSALIEPKTVLLLGFSPWHPFRNNPLVFHNREVCQKFDLPDFFRGDMLVMREVKPRMILKLLGTCLPDVFSKNLPGCIVYYMGCRVVPGKGHPAPFIHFSGDNITFGNLKLPFK